MQANTDIRPSFTYSAAYSEPSIWERFDNFIGSIGNWIFDHTDNIIYVLTILIIVALAVPFVGWLISLGWLWGIVVGILLGGLAYYAIMIVAGIFAFIAGIVLTVVRYVFYNGVTFLIALGLIAASLTYSWWVDTHNNMPYVEQTEEVTAPVSTPYVVTAVELNVREGPSTSSRVLGVVRKNHIVQVYGTTSGFARISYNGRFAYVGLKYIKPYE